MLTRLSIRDVVLVDRLDLAFTGSLGVLTGETGAGKSILLDALGLALGARADARLLRKGAGQAQVTAEFELAPDHRALAMLAERDLPQDQPLIFRRVVNADGRSRAYINDQPVSAGLLATLARELIEIHGHRDSQGLLNTATHGGLLDAFAGHDSLLAAVAGAWTSLAQARAAAAQAKTALEDARRDEELLRHEVAEIESLAPQPGEEETLAGERRFLAAGAKLAESLHAAESGLTAGADVEAAIGGARRALERSREDAGGRFDAALAALERAAIEAADALAEIRDAAAALTGDPDRLARVEDRLFALRALARKHDVAPDRLSEHGAALARRLAAIDDSDAQLKRLAEASAQALTAYDRAAGKLSASREKAAGQLEAAMTVELPPLKLEKARFEVMLEPLAENDRGGRGAERIQFLIAANPGTDPGPLNKVASGGELARIMLALRVVLAGKGAVPTLVFDEVDSGISGATANAVGERLARLGTRIQVLVVTHSPQVAARGDQHWRVVKRGDAKSAATTVEELAAPGRREEIARMLAGATVTDEARAAADRLLRGGA
ncbi:MAG: DNA repair protein RecN [Alphaproteobacteria bacterium]|nr:MAG: DNA repair protein RecN [Alphaproteobacteria bacterium]